MDGDRLRTLEWARRQLGHAHLRSTRRWLAKRGVRVVSGRLLQSAFYRVWQSPTIDLDAVVREAFGDPLPRARR